MRLEHLPPAFPCDRERELAHLGVLDAIPDEILDEPRTFLDIHRAAMMLHRHAVALLDADDTTQALLTPLQSPNKHTECCEDAASNDELTT